MRQRQHRQRHQPQRELRAPHLVRQQERRHHQERHLCYPRPLLGRQRDVNDCDATRYEQQRRHRVGHRRRLPEPQIGIEAPPAGERLEHVVDRVHVVAAAGVEPEELRPSSREQDHDRQVHHQPRHHRGDRRLADLAQLPCAHRQYRQRDRAAAVDTAWPPRRDRSAPRPAPVFVGPTPAVPPSRKPLPARRSW